MIFLDVALTSPGRWSSRPRAVMMLELGLVVMERTMALPQCMRVISSFGVKEAASDWSRTTVLLWTTARVPTAGFWGATVFGLRRGLRGRW